MAKRLTDEEKELREWQKQPRVKYVLQCNQCKRKHEVLDNIDGVIYFKDLICCNKHLIKNSKIQNKNCILLYERK